MLYCNVHVKVGFSKHIIAVQKDSGVVEGDYNTTKLIFEFEEDISNLRAVFKMNNPKGELIFLKDLTGNELILAGEDSSGNVCSIFDMEGLYPFEIVLYGDNSKLTSATGWLPVGKRQARADQGSGVDFYLPVFEETLILVKDIKRMIDEGGIGSSGVSDHADLTGRDTENQHPISAIENLQEELDGKRKTGEAISAEEISYINNKLVDETNTVKGALDEAVGFVLGNMPELVEKKHSHGNKTVLDKFSVNADNELQFDGKPVVSGGTDPQTNWVCKPILVDDKFVECVIHGSITNCISIETNTLPDNAKVKKIEIPDIVNGTNNYISLEDLIKVDPVGVQAPYFVVYPNAPGMFLQTVALVVFPILTNSFYDCVASSSFVGTTIKIYYEIEE